jgi:hypothetical protein
MTLNPNQSSLFPLGDAIFKGKSYANVRKEATADQLHQAATALGGLSAYPLSSVERTDNHDII